MKTYALYWAPEGRRIAMVVARTMRAAIRKAPYPYRRYLGEIYAVEVVHDGKDFPINLAPSDEEKQNVKDRLLRRMS